MADFDKRLQEELKKYGIDFKEIPHVWPGNCFGCSPRNEKGLKIKVSFEDNKCVSYTIISEHYCGFEGISHGGIIATLLDEISAFTIILFLHKTGVTTEANIKFYKQIKVNTLIRVEGQISEFENSRAIVNSYIKSVDGKILAACETIFLLPDMSSLAKLVDMEEEELQKMVDASINAVENIKN